MSVASESLPKHGTRMSFEEFQALGLPDVSNVSLYSGIVCVDDEAEDSEILTKRSWRHAQVEARISFLLHRWKEKVGHSGHIFSGEVGCEDARSGLDAGIDVAVFPDEVVAEQADSAFIQGLPILAVEVVSPADQQSKVKLKVDGYLTAGVPMVWVADPGFETVTVHRPGHTLRTFTGTEPVSGADILPGFEVSAAEFFN